MSNTFKSHTQAKAFLTEALEHFTDCLRDIDKRTPALNGSSSEPTWWLRMSILERDARALLDAIQRGEL